MVKVRMTRTTLCLTLALFGCAAAPPLDTPGNEATDEAALPPSALQPLGIVEAVSGTAPNAERAVRQVSSQVAACLKPALEREPWLRGELVFQLHGAEQAKATSVSGELASLAAASCVHAALNPINTSLNGQTIEYTLRFAGGYQPAEIEPRRKLRQRAGAVAWSAQNGRIPAVWEGILGAANEQLRRCAFGAEPQLQEPAWGVLRVGATTSFGWGTPTPNEAHACMQRVLMRLQLAQPRDGAEHALSVLLLPEPEEVDETELAAVQASPPSHGGITSLLNSGQGSSLRGIGVGGHVANRLRPEVPMLRMGKLTVNGKLEPEIVRRIVRREFGRIRLCYELALKQNPTLGGTVTVNFVIRPNGEVGKVTSSSELKHAETVACIERTFRGLSFPQLEGGPVTVAAPIELTPGAAPSASAPQKVGGKLASELSMGELRAALFQKAVPFVIVPASDGREPPALFVRDQDDRMFGVYFAQQGELGEHGDALCSAGSERRLVVSGTGCDAMLQAMLD